MSRFRDVQTDIEKIFATTEWTDESIQAFPANYAGGTSATEFVKVEIVPGTQTPRNRRSFANTTNVSGQVIIQIYVKTGYGLTRAMEIADILDGLLNSKLLDRGTNTGIPVLDVVGTDTDDKALYRVDFIVNFTKYT
jgi:hypothetical protein